MKDEPSGLSQRGDTQAPRGRGQDAIAITGLTKAFGKTVAVDALTLTVRRGEVFGFLGPNGAGKTTTIRMMMGTMRPTAGRIALAGFDLAAEPLAAKSLCGFVPDRPHIHERLSGREFLAFVCGLYDVPEAVGSQRATELLEMFELSPWASELVESYSHGMKQRLVLAAALIHAPEVLILDEPMVGMDPRGARLLKRTLRELANTGVSVFVSTHSLDVAEQTCDRVGIIQRGRLIACGSIDALRTTAGLPARAGLESIFLRLTAGDLEPAAGKAAPV